MFLHEYPPLIISIEIIYLNLRLSSEGFFLSVRNETI
jgi:hypothetical protein